MTQESRSTQPAGIPAIPSDGGFRASLAERILAISLCATLEELHQVMLQQADSIYPSQHWLYGEITDPARPVEVEILAFTQSRFQSVYQGMRVPILRSQFSHRLYEEQQISYVGEDTDTLSNLNPQFVETFALSSFMGIPLLFEDRVIGALFSATFKGETAKAPDGFQLEALQDIARVGALALHRMKVQAALEEQIQRVSGLNEQLRGLQVSLSEVAAQPDLGRVLHKLLELVQASTGVNFWTINGINEEGTILNLLASAGFPKDADPSPPIPLDGLNCGVSGRAAAEGRTVVTEDVAQDPHCEAFLHLLQPHGIRSAFSIPLRSRGGEVLGVMTGFAAVPGAPSDESLSQVEMLSVLATLAIERFHLWSRLQKELQQRKESEALYKTLVEESLSGVYLIQDGVFAYTNRAMQEMFGYTEPELARRSVADLVAPNDLPTVLEALRRRISGEITTSHYTFEAVRKDGRTIRVEVHGSRVDIMGRPAVLGVIMDITERIQAQELLRTSEERSRQLFDQSADAVLLADDSGFIMGNQAAAQLFGIPRTSIQGRQVGDFSPEF